MRVRLVWFSICYAIIDWVGKKVKNAMSQKTNQTMPPLLVKQCQPNNTLRTHSAFVLVSESPTAHTDSRNQ